MAKNKQKSKFDPRSVNLIALSITLIILGIILAKLYYVDAANVWMLETSSGTGTGGLSWREHLFITVPSYLYVASILLIIVAIVIQVRKSHK